MSAVPKSVPSRPRQPQGQPSSRRTQQLPERGSRAEKMSTVLQQRQHAAKVWESGTILGINVLLIGTAIVTLAHLIPNQLTQQAKLQEIQTETAQINQNVQALEQSYERNQSPEAAQRIAQEQGNLIRANQKQVYFLPNTPSQVQ